MKTNNDLKMLRLESNETGVKFPNQMSLFSSGFSLLCKTMSPPSFYQTKLLIFGAMHHSHAN